MPTDDDDVTAMSFFDENGKPIGFSSIGEAAEALREYLEDDGVIEVHAEGCDGQRGPECDCGVEVLSAAELFPRATA